MPVNSEPQYAIVFIHGAGGSHKNWAYQIDHFGRGHLALAVDLPGHGKSGGYSAREIDVYVDFVKTFINHLIATPFILVGHSMGGAIAMSYARQYPCLLSGLVLVGTGPRLKVLPAILNSIIKGDIVVELVNLLFNRKPKSNLLRNARDELSNMSPQVFLNDFTACNNFDISDHLCDIKTPTLIVSAGKDRLTPLKCSEFLNTCISDSSIFTIEKAGHMMMMECPQEFNLLMESFILSL